MKLTATITTNIDIRGLQRKLDKALRFGMRDTIVLLHHDSVVDSPALTGHNRRSLAAEVSGMGLVAGSDNERVVDDKKLEGAVYSTSGYGGYLEVGTVHMAARPYISPARDRHVPDLPKKIRKYMESA